VTYLKKCNLIREERSADDGRIVYVMTELGKRMHGVLKDYAYLGPLFGDLSRNRRRRQ